MTQACKDAVTSPDYRYAYLNDLDIPRDYPIHVVSDGDIIDLGGREWKSLPCRITRPAA
mgnify:CR=1 FL=1